LASPDRVARRLTNERECVCVGEGAMSKPGRCVVEDARASID
jgi:hypothetical protein